MSGGSSDFERAFLALPLPSRLIQTLENLNPRVTAQAPGFSCPKPADAHLTLCFAGRVTGSAADAIAAGMDEVCRPFSRFAVQPGEARFFGTKRRPRVVWLGFRPSPALAGLQEQLADAVRRAGVELETRPFRPHLTIARVRKPVLPGSLTSVIACINNTNFAEIPVDRVLFLNSRLNGPGPRYTTIHQSFLEGS